MSGPYYDPNQPTPQKSSSSWIWIALGIVLLILIACGGACAGMAFFVSRQASQGIQAMVQIAELSQLQMAAFGAIQNHTEVTEKIGDVTGFGAPTLIGMYGPEQPSVSCSFTVNGSKGSATATVTGNRESGALRPTDIQVKFADGTTVDVPPGEYTPDLNFNIEPQETMPADDSMPADGDSSDAAADGETGSN
jgi:hypothetical protein